MILIGKKHIVDFGKAHANSRKALATWEKVVTSTNYTSLNELKKTFPNADYAAHQYTIFNIDGNNYSLIAEIDYSASVVHVKRIWTHAEYDMKKNEDVIRGHKL